MLAFGYLLLQWAAAIDSLEHGSPGSDKSFGMKQRPDGDIEIDEKFWEEDFIIPPCQKCGGVLKPDVCDCSNSFLFVRRWDFHFMALTMIFLFMVFSRLYSLEIMCPRIEQIRPWQLLKHVMHSSF